MLQHAIRAGRASNDEEITICYPLLTAQSSLLRLFFSSHSICGYLFPPTPKITTPTGLLQPTDISCAGKGVHHVSFLHWDMPGLLPRLLPAPGQGTNGASLGRTGVTNPSCCQPGGSCGSSRLPSSVGKGCAAAACPQTPPGALRSGRLWFLQGQPCLSSWHQRRKRSKITLRCLVLCEVCC